MGLRDKCAPFFEKCGCGKKQNTDDSTKEVKAKEAGGRAKWSSPTEFLLTCIGYSVGLGNVWRFPYLCYQKGGGAFLIPYIIMMFLIGFPLLFMEYAFGQYFGVGGLTVFKKVCPMFRGVGIGYMVLNGLVCIYYNVIIAIALYYLFASFTAHLPWGSCGHEWNTLACGDPISDITSNITDNGTLYNNVTSMLGLGVSEPTYTALMDNQSALATVASNLTRTSPSDEYFRLELLEVGPEHNIANLGKVRWHLCLCLLLAWILVILFVSKGIKSTGKVAYFTATFPYIMLTVLVVRGVTLPGAAKGILYFITPEWEKLKDPEVWYGAASQLFYSTNLAWGGMITMASYNSFNHNCFRDAIMINIVSFFTSLYAGFAVFSIIGYMAHQYNIDIRDVIDSGPGLAFIVYPRALSLMPLAPMWSALFFFMLFLLGIGSQMVQVETIMTGLREKYPVLNKTARTRFLAAIGVGIIGFFLGLACTTQGGMYVLQLMDWYSASFSVLFIAVVECVAISWLYGNARFSANVKEMLGRYPARWWRICWQYISPLLIVAILIFSFVKYEPAQYGKYFYPLWADLLGWVMVLAAVVPVFAIAIVKLVKADGNTLLEKFKKVTEPQLGPEHPMQKSMRTSIEEIDSFDKKTPMDDVDKLETLDEGEAQRKTLLVGNNMEVSKV